MGIKINLAGIRFGRLMVLGDTGRRAADGVIIWRCQCACGDVKDIYGKSLTNGRTRSCGCLNIEVARRRGSETIKNAHRYAAQHGPTARTHGKSQTRTYKIWSKMISRCTNPNDVSYRLYGAIGRTVCKRWRNFETFLADMGECPPRYSIDRIDNSKGYEPGNCRWATANEQARNMGTNHVIAAHGQSMILTDWAARLGVSPSTISQRLKAGWPEKLAVTLPKGARLQDYIDVDVAGVLR
jgi:hypothetical protein